MADEGATTDGATTDEQAAAAQGDAPAATEAPAGGDAAAAEARPADTPPAKTHGTIGATPIDAGGTSAGEDPKGAPEWDEFDAEVSKQGTLEGENLNWGRVAELGRTIVEKRSKDLKTASNLVAALQHTSGLAGMVEGLTIVTDMVAAHWEGLFPPRPRGRQTAIQFITDNLTTSITELPVGEGERPLLEQGNGIADELAELIAAKFDGQSLGLNKLSKAFRDKLKFLDENKPPEGAAPPAGGQPAVAAGTGAPVPGAISASGPPISRDDAFRKLKEVADFLAKFEPQNPVTFLVKRASKWSDMKLDEIMTELLGNEKNAKKAIWDHLGIVDDGK